VNLYRVHVKIRKFDGRIQTKIIEVYAKSKDQAIGMASTQFSKEGQCTFKAVVVKGEAKP
jgi:hypothetical protein